MSTTDIRRRPGYPRKERSTDLDRITLRVRADLYKAMGKICQSSDMSQREVVEAAIRSQLGRKPKVDRPHPEHGQELSRTGMWIDPQLLKDMDARILEEGSRQRAFIEDALDSHLAKLTGQKTTKKGTKKNARSKKRSKT